MSHQQFIPINILQIVRESFEICSTPIINLRMQNIVDWVYIIKITQRKFNSVVIVATDWVRNLYITYGKRIITYNNISRMWESLVGSVTS